MQQSSKILCPSYFLLGLIFVENNFEDPSECLLTFHTHTHTQIFEYKHDSDFKE